MSGTEEPTSPATTTTTTKTTTTTTTDEQPIAKKAKMTLPEAPATEWPEAWIIPKDIEDQYAPNKLEPNVPVTVEDLKKIGICYWKLDADTYTYPTKAIPWDPKDAKDPMLQQLRDDRGYSYADIITVHPDHLPEFETKLKAFFEEHIHDAEEIRYILGGSGYFDVRNLEDTWVRIHIKKGDLMTLPEGTTVGSLVQQVSFD
jgi:1,2-dihydroxy-3-keto-5-methylthiopentene dioxygenase